MISIGELKADAFDATLDISMGTSRHEAKLRPSGSGPRSAMSPRCRGRVVRPASMRAASCLVAAACGPTVVATLMLVLPGFPRPRCNVGRGRGGGGAGTRAARDRARASQRRAGRRRTLNTSCASCHGATGAGDGYFPSHYYNTAVGHRDPSDLLAVLLNGVQRTSQAKGSVLMPGFDGSPERRAAQAMRNSPRSRILS